MKNKKTFALIVLFILVCSSIYAFEIKNDSYLQGACFAPQKTFAVIETMEFSFSEGKLNLVPYVGLGYSMRYYWQTWDNPFSSKAILYGPTFRFGISTVLNGQFASYQLGVGMEGVYSNFPVILYKSSEISLIKPIKDNLNFKASLGFLKDNSVPSIKIALGIGKKI